MIACISDVRLGYGSPQIVGLVRHLAAAYGARVVIIEPRHSSDSREPVQLQDIEIRPVSAPDPYDPSGREHYTSKAASIVDDLRPDMLVVCTTYSLPALFAMKSRPPRVLYYYLEVASIYGPGDVAMNGRLGGRVDAIVFTEENRAVHFGQTWGFQKIPFCVVYNCVNGPDVPPPLQREGRNGRFLYQGSIRDDTLVDLLAAPEVEHHPIDIYGSISEHNRARYEAKFAALQCNVRYLGHRTSSELALIRPRYAYSFVLWRPDHANNRYASPNKLFESVASGVPPICTPNPQCAMVLRRYGCGVLMEDYGYDQLREKILLAAELYGTDEYGRMVGGCMRAVREELNWPAQMKKFDALLARI